MKKFLVAATFAALIITTTTTVSANDIQEIGVDDVFVVWVCKTLQNYKCVIGTRATAVLAEYTYNGNDGVLYEGIYKKIVNASHLVE